MLTITMVLKTFHSVRTTVRVYYAHNKTVRTNGTLCSVFDFNLQLVNLTVNVRAKRYWRRRMAILNTAQNSRRLRRPEEEIRDPTNVFALTLD